MAHARSAGADGEPADAAWARAEQRILDQAAAVPLIAPKSKDFISKRLGHYQYSPQVAILLEQLWVIPP